MVNAHIDRWRRRPWREQPTDDLPDVAVPAGTGDVDARHGLLAALARLSRRQRAVVVLRYFEDLSEAEIARTLGCSLPLPGLLRRELPRGALGTAVVAMRGDGTELGRRRP